MLLKVILDTMNRVHPVQHSLHSWTSLFPILLGSIFQVLVIFIENDEHENKL